MDIVNFTLERIGQLSEEFENVSLDDNTILDFLTQLPDCDRILLVGRKFLDSCHDLLKEFSHHSSQ